MGVMVRLRDFERYGIYAGFSRRDGGESEQEFASLNVGLHVGDDAQAVLNNRHMIAEELGIADDRITYAQQVHGAQVAVISESMVGLGAKSFADAVSDTDAMVSTVNHAGLAIVAADCVPMLFVDIRHHVIGAAHAGWRGAAAGIAQKTVETMIACGASRDFIYAVLGPSIRGCCYEVDEQVIVKARAFYKQIGKQPSWKRSPRHADRVMLDLPTLCRDDLAASGIAQTRILDVAVCTNCMDGYFSHRRDHGKTGRHGGFIALRM